MGINTSCHHWTSKLFGRPEGSGVRGGIGGAVQSRPAPGGSPPAAGSCPDRSGQSHKPPRPQTHTRTSPREGASVSGNVAGVHLFKSSVPCCRGGPCWDGAPPSPSPWAPGGHVSGQTILEAPTRGQTWAPGRDPARLAPGVLECPQNTLHTRRLQPPPQTRGHCGQVMVIPSVCPHLALGGPRGELPFLPFTGKETEAQEG